MKQKKLMIFLSFLTVYIVWGSTFLAIRIALDSFPPFCLVGLRFVISGVLLGLPTWYLGGFKAITRRQIFLNCIQGILMIALGNGALVWAEQGVLTGTASLWIASVPICILLFNWTLFERKMPAPTAMIGALLGCVGVSLLPGASVAVSNAKYPHHYYLVALVVSVTSWSFSTLSQKRIGMKAGTSWQVSAIHMFSGGCFMVVASLLSGELSHIQWNLMSAKSVAALAYLIFFGSILAFSAFGWLLANVHPQKVATYAMVNPVLALILGSSLAGEKIGSQLIAAASVVLLGVAFIMFSPKRS